ncbi:MAG: 2-oxo acid dehydrogenase subunit E2, partial [Flavobacteriales bacterium]|nr:2-oxo acid dehydrogenase subunit E2 [Flavobacteriales bacterium]
FSKKYGQKITYTPIFVEAVVKALQEFPLINVSVDGNKIIKKSDLNIGLAAALPNGNLIVPVIRNADRKNLLGLATEVNDLVYKARNNKLKADEISGSTFTISNVGTFRNLMGTPIINQPEVAILATGSIKKRPMVVETDIGDVIAIRHMIYLSLSFDHRVVDGNLGGSFLARIGDFLEEFDADRII